MIKLKQLSLRNFRNIRSSSLYPEGKLNFLVGSNGQGKTNFMEAIGLLSTLRSFRDSKAASVVRWGEMKGEISCTLVADETIYGTWKTDLKLDFRIQDESRSKCQKEAFINGKSYKSSTQYLSRRFGSHEMGFHCVIFNPSDHDLVRGDPSIRRSYLDRVIMAEDIEYLKVQKKYRRILEQRNALLKTPQAASIALLSGFTDELCRYGSLITLKRLQWIKDIAGSLESMMSRIAPQQSAIKLSYISEWAPTSDEFLIKTKDLQTSHFAGQRGLASLELLEWAFRAKVLEVQALERRVGYSLVGPHRDDWAFFLGNRPLKGHGSQGEIRSVLLALKLSEIESFRKVTGHRPLFLLDDFSSELDRERRTFLLNFLMDSDLQTFVTTTEDISSSGKKFRIMNGQIINDTIGPTGN